MAKSKFYVVWKGRQRGVFNSWDQCRAQIFEFPGAAYKAFDTKQSAEEAFKLGANDFIGKGRLSKGLPGNQTILIGNPIQDSIAVDGAWNTATGEVEYQGVYVRTQKVLFRQGPYHDGTNNIVEFLGIVHALAYCKKNNLALPVYSDSRNAIKWVKDKEARTKQKRSNENKKLFELVDRAIVWLKENHYENKILKWETKAWGENPADFGRK
jgi:ribonuclease HI